MTRTLLTGASGFIAAHVLDSLLHRGHSVVATVRSAEKAQRIRDAHPGISKEKLDFVIVPDIAQANAFDKAVVSDPPFDLVIHTASPFHFEVTDGRKELVAPAVNGTVGILRAIKQYAPSVKRVVITSSFAAIINPKAEPKTVFSEEMWNPIADAEIELNAANAYRASKTFAERAAFEFVEKEKPNFTIATCNPPLVLGPLKHYLPSLNALNTSNQRIRNFITGALKGECSPTGVYLWVDVRDLAEAHLLAAEKPEAAGQRFFITAGNFSNKEIVDIIAETFPEYRDKLPTGEALTPGDYPPQGVWGYNNQKSKDLLGLVYRSLRESVVDTVKSLQEEIKRLENEQKGS